MACKEAWGLDEMTLYREIDTVCRRTVFAHKTYRRMITTKVGAFSYNVMFEKVYE